MKTVKFSRIALAVVGVMFGGAAQSQAVDPATIFGGDMPPPIPGVASMPDAIPGSVPPWVEVAIPASDSPVELSRVPALASAGGTQSLPPPPAAEPPPPVNLLSGTDSVLTPRERANVAASQRWIAGPKNDGAGVGTNGAVTFRFGGAMPTVVCAPLYVCELALQAGEVVNGIDVGDSVRWRISPALSGSGASETVHVVIKPHDIGLTTNLLVTTDRLVYSLKLVSRRDDWMPSVAFSYPEDDAAAWAAVRLAQAKQAADTIIPETGQSLRALDFNYRLRGDKPTWRPLRVYHDGKQTHIQFPPAMVAGEAPALVALGDGKEKYLVNYRVVGDRFVVDKVLDRAMLVSGVGRKQTAVRIERGN